MAEGEYAVSLKLLAVGDCLLSAVSCFISVKANKKQNKRYLDFHVLKWESRHCVEQLLHKMT